MFAKLLLAIGHIFLVLQPEIQLSSHTERALLYLLLQIAETRHTAEQLWPKRILFTFFGPSSQIVFILGLSSLHVLWFKKAIGRTEQSGKKKFKDGKAFVMYLNSIGVRKLHSQHSGHPCAKQCV